MTFIPFGALSNGRRRANFLKNTIKSGQNEIFFPKNFVKTIELHNFALALCALTISVAFSTP